MFSLHYLDHAATTPVPEAVAKTMYDVLTGQFGNPSSQYPIGREAKALVEQSRKTVASALGCQAEELYFTSSGSTGIAPFCVQTYALTLTARS